MVGLSSRAEEGLLLLLSLHAMPADAPQRQAPGQAHSPSHARCTAILPTLPPATAAQVWASRGMCQQVLHVPGVEEPLARLHGALDTLQ